MTDKLLRVSINRLLIDKNEGGDNRLYAEGFETAAITIEQLADEIKRGHAFAPELSGRRNAKNFVAADVAAIDIDYGTTVEEALEHPLVKNHAGLVYTTASHTSDRPRFRIVFPLAETITDGNELQAAMRSLALRMGGDVAATDPARLFFGNRQAEVWVYPDQQLSVELQDELIAQSANSFRRGADARQPSIRSGLRLDPNQMVTLASGQVIAVSKVGDKAQLHCPFHADRHASAFVVTSRAGARGIHCMACGDTFWPADAPDAMDLFSFDSAVVQAHAAHGENVCQTRFPFLRGFDGRANITIIEHGTGLDALMPGLTFVKAPKGAGKTAALNRLLPMVKTAVVIMHRRMLSRQACRRLDIPCYLDVAHLDHDRIGVCFDSLVRLQNRSTFKLVVIDEVEQVLAHILSDTISSVDRIVLLRKFIGLLRAADSVVAMHADIGWASFVTLTRLMNGVIPDPEQGDLFRDRSSPVRLLMNVSKPGDGKTIDLYTSKTQLVAELVDALVKEKRVFVAANTKAFAEKIDALVAEKLPSCRRLLLTADTASGMPQKVFLENPAETSLNYDAIITSPAAGTGLDITFPARAVMIDAVFGFCEADIVTHWDFDQHISRVRQPGAVKVWISPQRCHYETHADVVRRDLLDGILRAHVILSTGHAERPDRIDDDPLVEMATMVEAQKRSSKNNISNNFIALKKAQGFGIVVVEPAEEAKTKGSELLKMARSIGEREYARRIMASLPLGRISYLKIREAIEAGATVTQDQRWSLERRKIEGFYREQISVDLIERDDRGRFRGRVKLFESLAAVLPRPQVTALPKRSAVIYDPDHLLQLMQLLFEATPLVRDGAWDRDVVFSGEDLEAFCDIVEQQKRAFEMQTKRQVRRDLRAKSMLQLHQLLRMLGLGLDLARTEKAATGKRYFYRLDRAALQLLGEISRRRESISPGEFLQHLYGEIPDEDDDAFDFFGA
ncbi:MAG: plasmid replication protein, CyRepA1 family [Pseudolabrys sp.]|jgi:hypothetical protein